MAYRTRETPDAMIWALATAWNAKQVAQVSTNFHFDATQLTTGDYKAPVVTAVTVAAANATDTATAVTLVNEIKADLNIHYADTTVHDTAVSAAITTADAT
ncbi:MAG: hypothetical protein ACYTBJ_23445, partial [Planctomycetota bacterium]